MVANFSSASGKAVNSAATNKRKRGCHDNDDDDDDTKLAIRLIFRPDAFFHDGCDAARLDIPCGVVVVGERVSLFVTRISPRTGHESLNRIDPSCRRQCTFCESVNSPIKIERRKTNEKPEAYRVANSLTNARNRVAISADAG